MTRRKSPQLPAEAFDRLPRVSLALGDETIWLTRFDDRGQPLVTYPVAAEDVVAAFNPFGASTGLLPADTLFWQNVAGVHRIGIWLPPAVRAITLAGRHEEHLRVPLPGLVFVGQGTRYFVWAAKERPSTLRDRLYRAPLPNVYHDGLICAGNAKFPVCAPDTIHKAAELFFESAFNDHLTDEKIRDRGSLLTFLKSLRGKRAFPAGQLVMDNTTLENVIHVEQEPKRGNDRPNIDEYGVVHLDPDQPAPDLALWINRPFVFDGDWTFAVNDDIEERMTA
jgi:PRTRC genetic system protein B